jgi:hypothetical protein
MPLNIGYIELQSGDGVDVHVYYDTTFTPVGDSQPLINGPRGYCLDVTNTSGSNAKVDVTTPTGATQTFTVGQGNPVTSGQGRSRTANQMKQLGLTTRGDLTNFDLS